MIELSLYEYLTDPRELIGEADTQLFKKAIKIGSLTVTNRNDARRFLRDRVGKGRIYSARRLEPAGQTAITITSISGSPESHLLGDDRTVEIVQLDVFSKVSTELMVVAELLRIAVTRYRGVWGISSPAYIGTVTKERGSTREVAPRDGSQYWTFWQSSDYQINFSQNLVEV